MNIEGVYWSEETCWGAPWDSRVLKYLAKGKVLL